MRNDPKGIQYYYLRLCNNKLKNRQPFLFESISFHFLRIQIIWNQKKNNRFWFREIIALYLSSSSPSGLFLYLLGFAIGFLYLATLGVIKVSGGTHSFWFINQMHSFNEINFIYYLFLWIVVKWFRENLCNF